MHVSFLTLFAMSAAALAQLGQVDIERPVAMTVRLGSEDTVSFRISQRVVTDIDLHVRGAEYSVPLQCTGGLHDVNFGTVELYTSGESGRRRTAVLLCSSTWGTRHDHDE